MTKNRAAIYAHVRRIPAGRVATYGQIAHLVGAPRSARQVGQALAALDDDSDVPWHRVVNAQGRISPRRDAGSDEFQRLLLEDEGVVFDATGRIDLARYAWPGRRAVGQARGN
jgi:methylated-DNA-protein-cysteine methyltransferase-like protein